MADDRVYCTMVPFELKALTRMFFGTGAVERVGRLARELGGHRVLLVSDPGVVRTGHTDSVRTRLIDAGLEVFAFDGFGASPDSDDAERGRGFAAPLAIDLIVAVGGGSSLDCAKAINFLLTNGGAMADYRGYGKITTRLLPMIGVPTTAGTGSEAQSYAVIADAATKMKMACGDPSAAFTVALLDPALTMSAPRGVTATAGYDAIAHAVETTVTTRRTPLSDAYSLQAWRLLSGAYERALTQPSDFEARSAMQVGAFLAGLAIEHSMLGAAHACANPLTARYDLTHGAALAILLPHVVRWNADIATERYALLVPTAASAPAEALATQLEHFAAVGGLATTLSAAGVEPGALTALAAQAAQQWTGGFNPRSFDAEGALEIYQAAL
ncbi:MAG: iron-containing alcohol dehydrogenase [Vicinamibacterales bacterium]